MPWPIRETVPPGFWSPVRKYADGAFFFRILAYNGDIVTPRIYKSAQIYKYTNCFMEKMSEQNLERPEREREYTMEGFLAEMRELKRQQEEEHISQDLAETDVDVLTEEDMRMWKTIEEWRGNPLSSKEMRERLDDYSKAFFDENGNLRENIPRSRYAFCQLARSKAGEVIVRKQMEEMRGEKKI